LYRGVFGGAGEIGHAKLTAFVKASADAKALADGSAGRQIYEFEELAGGKAFKKGLTDKEVAKNLAVGIADAIAIFEPELIVVGGGVAAKRKNLVKIASRSAKELIFSPLAKKTKIVLAKYPEDAAAMGAAGLFDKKVLYFD
jgi:predicted NBD/HSP70 family sugar kinase